MGGGDPGEGRADVSIKLNGRRGQRDFRNWNIRQRQDVDILQVVRCRAPSYHDRCDELLPTCPIVAWHLAQVKGTTYTRIRCQMLIVS